MDIPPAAGPDLPPQPSAEDFVRAVLGATVRALIRNEPGVRLGLKAKHVHKARVSTRRLRSNLWTLRNLFDGDSVQRLRHELKWLGAALGSVRDTEVLFERLTKRTEELTKPDRPDARALLTRLAAERDEKHAELLIVIRSDRYVDLLEALKGLLEHPPLREAASHGEAADVVSLVRRPWKELRQAARSVSADSTDAEIHAVRILAKRCRYAAQAVAPFVGPAADTFAAACQRVQDLLGEHQDCVVAQAWLRRNALLASSREAFAAGQLAILEGQAAMAARGAWPGIWRKLDRPELRLWLSP